MTRKKLLVFALVAGFALGVVPGLRPAALQAADLESIAFVKEAPGVVFTVRLQGEFGSEAFMLREPDRLVIDVSPIEKLAAAEQAEVDAGGVLRVRTGRFQADVARLVFDLEGPGVMYRIDRAAEGLKVTFWKEDGSVPRPEEKPRRAQDRAPARDAKAGERPARPRRRAPGKARGKEARPALGERRFCRRARRLRQGILRPGRRRDRNVPEPRIDAHPKLPHQ